MDALRILEEYSPELPAVSRDKLKTSLALCLNQLLLHDFGRLVQLLYTIDVSEAKLKRVLKENPSQDAGNLLADLLLQRQREKLAARQSFQAPDKASDEEGW